MRAAVNAGEFGKTEAMKVMQKRRKWACNRYKMLRFLLSIAQNHKAETHVENKG